MFVMTVWANGRVCSRNLKGHEMKIIESIDDVVFEDKNGVKLKYPLYSESERMYSGYFFERCPTTIVPYEIENKPDVTEYVFELKFEMDKEVMSAASQKEDRIISGVGQVAIFKLVKHDIFEGTSCVYLHLFNMHHSSHPCTYNLYQGGLYKRGWPI